MRIVVDAMGTDNFPKPDVGGAVLAVREWGDEVILVGDEARIQSALDEQDAHGLPLRVVHASQIIEMTDKPAQAAKFKTDSSMHVGLRLVETGEADGFVSAGNTGGVLAVAILHTLGRIQGVKRPALAVIIPTAFGRVVAVDIGANTDCRPEYLVQFAIMGRVFAECILNMENPRVGLLSTGEEEGKGNHLVKEASALLAGLDLNFVGNVEPKDVLGDKTDVVVQDGFTGNIMMKSFEALAGMLNNILRQEITADPLTALGGALARPAFGRAARRVDPFEIGGAALLGVNGVVVTAHGRSNAVAIKNAIRQARRAVQGGMIQAICEGIGGEGA
jgi:glycerol-3-phosphate acyltransferase PlsX